MLLMRALASIVTVSHSGDGYYNQNMHCYLLTKNTHDRIFKILPI